MSTDLGKLILRLTLGLLILLHGIAKIMHGTAGVEKMLMGIGLPTYLAYGVYIGEVLAPILVLLGFYARVGAGLIAVNMVFAVVLAHQADLFRLTKTGGWALELQAFFLFTAIAVLLLGPGRFSLNKT